MLTRSSWCWQDQTETQKNALGGEFRCNKMLTDDSQIQNLTWGASIILSDGHCPSSTLDKSSMSLWEARNNGSTSLSTDSSILPRFSLPQPQNMPSHTRNLFCFPSPRQSSQLLCTLPAVRTKHLYTAVVLEGMVPCRQCTVSSAEAEATTTTKIRNPEKMSMPGSFCVVRWRCGILLPPHGAIPAAAV